MDLVVSRSFVDISLNPSETLTVQASESFRDIFRRLWLRQSRKCGVPQGAAKQPHT